MTEHILKTWRYEFDATERGEKRFEYRPDDRDFEVGDVLVLLRYDPVAHAYVLRDDQKVESYDAARLRMRVTYLLRHPRFGVPRDYCVMSIEPEAQP